MSEMRALPKIPEGLLTQEQIDKISGGGDCTLADYLTFLESAQRTYEATVDFTSYVIERVANSL